MKHQTMNPGLIAVFSYSFSVVHIILPPPLFYQKRDASQ